MYYLYVDIVLFINMVVDVVVLRLLMLTPKARMSAFGIILAGALGALWSCILAVYPVFPPGLQLALVLFLAEESTMKVTPHTKEVRGLIKGMFGLYLVSMASGGVITALYRYTETGYYVE